MSDLSKVRPVERLSEEWWAERSPEVQARRCTAHRKNGAQCAKVAMDAQRVCGTHGGRAPQAKRKARQRIEEAQDLMARELLKMAVDDSITDATKLNAIKHALAIGGLSEKTSVEVEVGLKPWEEVLQGISSITRAESRAARGLPAPTDAPNELTARPGRPYEHELNIVDAEVEEAPVPPPSSTGGPRTPADPPPGSPPPFADPPAISGPRLQTEEDAMADIAAARRNARTVQVRRVRRR